MDQTDGLKFMISVSIGDMGREDKEEKAVGSQRQRRVVQPEAKECPGPPLLES